MTKVRNTPAQGLEQLHRDSLKLLYSLAQSTLDAAKHTWIDAARGRRAAELTRFIKRDLEEFQNKLKLIRENHGRIITSKVLAQPHHPVMLKAGGDYYDFVDQVTATVSPFAGELIDLIRQEAHTPQTKVAVQ